MKKLSKLLLCLVPIVFALLASQIQPISWNTPEVPIEMIEPEVTAVPVETAKPDVTLPEFTFVPTQEETVETHLELHQINVGCGDAYLLRSEEFTIMIDGGQKDSSSGGKNVRQRVLNYLENAGVTHIDAYIGTHWHGDHVENMIPILEKFADDNTVVFGNSPKLPDIYSLSSWKGNYTQMVDGDVFQFGNITIKCVGPYKLFKDENYNSLNILVTMGETRMLLTGDYVHKEILDKYGEELKDIDVYKMAHHGLKVSNYCGSPDVLPHLNPDIVLVPANSSGPTQDMVVKFGISAQVYDNKSGNILVVSDGKEITVTTEK